jgi:hypothetical protein
VAGDSMEDVMQRAFAKIEQTDTREAEAQQQAAAVEAAAAALAEARQRVAESGEPWTLGDDVAGLVDTVVKADPVNAARWLVLANLRGAETVERVVKGGVLGVGGLARLESAVHAELARSRSIASWLKDGGTVTLADMASKEPRVPLWKQKGPTDPDGKTAIPGGVVGLVVAPGGVGKTSWLVELAMRTAAGQSFDALGWSLGTYRNRHGRPVTPKFSVMAVLAEEDETGRNDGCRRVWAAEEHARKEYNEALGRMRIWYGAGQDTALGEQVQLDDPIRGRVTTVQGSAFHAELCAHARRIGPALIVLDPINQLLPAGMSENDATSAAAIIRLANELRNAAEEGMLANLPDDEKGNAHAYPMPTVLLAHHENKGGGSGAAAVRGSTAFADNARLVIQMSSEAVRVMGQKETEHYTIWKVIKTNYTTFWTTIAKAGRDDGIVWTSTHHTPETLAEAKALAEAAAEGTKTGQERLVRTAARDKVLDDADRPPKPKKPKDQAPAPASPAVPLVRLELPADDKGDPWAE